MEETSMETDNIETVNEFPVENVIPEAETSIPDAEEVPFQYPALFTGQTLLELCNSSWCSSPKAKVEVQPYLRGCKWSPDGTCCLSVVNNDGVHVTELPRDLYSGSAGAERTIDVLDSVIHVKEAGLVYDFCWYPGMNSSIPETCCWLTTKQNAPVQMWDAFDGSLRCSYRGFSPVVEMEPAVTTAFTLDGARIIAGYKKVLRTFDVERPGRDCAEHKINFPASCLAMHSNLLAVGSWNTTISLFNVNELGSYKSIGKMQGHSGGITHMKFTSDGLKLVSGARKDNRLLVFDIRYYRRPLNILSRVVDTNQRVYFDISPCGKYLVSGGTDGVLKVWDADSVDWSSGINVTEQEDNVTFKFPLFRDCCNSVSIHPSRPIIATGSGQYHFKDPIEDEVERNGNVNLDGDTERQSDVDYKFKDHAENSLVFWWVGDVDVPDKSNIL